MVEDVLDGEAGVAELLHSLATGNDDVPGEAGEGLQDSRDSLGNMITKLQTHLPSFSYLVSQTHLVCGEKLLGSKAWEPVLRG